MDGNTTISVALLISVASIVFTALNYRRNAKKDDEEHQREKEKQVENRLKMNLKLDQLCNTTNEIRSDTKATFEQMRNLEKRVGLVEQSTKTLHERLDDHIKQTRGIDE
mgnify:FL=1|jgi:hypothetical protein